MRKLFLLSIILTVLSTLTGCSMLGIREKSELTIDQKVNIIKSTATSATFLALTENSDDNEELVEKANDLKAPIENDVLPLLQDGSVTFDSITIGLLEEKIDRRYMLYLQQTIALLQLYYEVPDVGDFMSPEDISLWIALFEGIVKGANQALLTTE